MSRLVVFAAGAMAGAGVAAVAIDRWAARRVARLNAAIEAELAGRRETVVMSFADVADALLAEFELRGRRGGVRLQ